MAGGKLNFWGVVTASCAAFAFLILVIIFASALVYSIYRGTPNVPEEEAIANTEPAGKVFFRDN